MKVKFKELNSGYEGEKRTSRLSQKSKAKIIIAAVLVFSFLTVFWLSEFGVVPLGSLVSRACSKISGDEKNFPLSIETDATKNIKMLGNKLLVLTTESYTIYSVSGEEAFSGTHPFASPSVSINGKNAVLFDREGTAFILITDSEEVFSGTVENKILSAEYGKDGTYALATESPNATTELSVFDSKNKLIFKWESAYDRISSIALSNDGKFAGVCALGAENGDIYTKVDYFGFNYKDPLNTQKLSGSAALNIEFNGADLSVVCDDGIYRVTKKGEVFEAVKSYYSTEFISFSANSKANTAIALAKYGSTNLYEISVFSKSGKQRASFTTDNLINSLYMSDKYIFALATDKIMVYNLSGGLVSTTLLSGEAYGIFATDSFVFVPSLDKISRCYSFADSTL